MKLERLDEETRHDVMDFAFLEYETSPWTPLEKPLSQCKVALVTSAGLHLRSDVPFVTYKGQEEDSSYRVIPSDVQSKDLVTSHISIGFDHIGVYQDINVAFPIDRVRELVEDGTIGGLSDSYYSFMGGVIYPSTFKRLMQETGPEAAQRMKAEGVDLVFLTPV